MKNKFLKTTLAALCITGFITANAQSAITNPSTSQPQTANEVSVGITGFNANSFSLRYQHDNGQNFFRMGLLVLGVNTKSNVSNFSSTDTAAIPSTDTANTPVNLSFGINFIWGTFSPINDRFAFETGFEIGTNFNYTVSYSSNTLNSAVVGAENNTSKDITTGLRPYVGLLLGVRYKINSSFSAYAEIAPNIYYNYSKSTTTTNNNATSNTSTTTDVQNDLGLTGLQNMGATLAFAYTF